MQECTEELNFYTVMVNLIDNLQRDERLINCQSTADRKSIYIVFDIWERQQSRSLIEKEISSFQNLQNNKSIDVILNWRNRNESIC